MNKHFGIMVKSRAKISAPIKRQNIEYSKHKQIFAVSSFFTVSVLICFVAISACGSTSALDKPTFYNAKPNVHIVTANPPSTSQMGRNQYESTTKGPSALPNYNEKALTMALIKK